jgi:hypothetical protein
VIRVASGILRALALAVGFELRLLIRQLIPAFVLGSVMWVLLCAGLVGASALMPGPELDRIVVVVADPRFQEDDGLLETLTDRLEDVSIEVVDQAPKKPADVEVWIPEDAARGAWHVVGSERAAVERVRPIAVLTQAWVRQQVALDEAERERLFALDQTTEAVADALDDASGKVFDTPRFWGGVLFVVALVFGVGSVRQNAYRRDEGLATLLRIGTPRLALFLVEMFGSALALGGIAFFATLLGWMAADEQRDAVPWLLLALGGLFALWLQTGLLGVLLGTVERERDQELHLDILLMPMGAVAAWLAWDVEGVARVVLGLVPVFGVLAVGATERPGPMAAMLLLVQLGWGVLALERGAWMFTLSEPLRDAVARRWRRS